MANDRPRIAITAKRRVLKYAEGTNPETGEPFEVVEKVDIIEGEEAERLLKQLDVEVTDNATN